MNTKLTLSIDNQVIIKAKEYAKNSGRSLSDLIENYLKNISSSESHNFDICPKVKVLMGAFKAPLDFDYKSELSNAIFDKHIK
jgi:hypothetical protein